MQRGKSLASTLGPPERTPWLLILTLGLLKAGVATGAPAPESLDDLLEPLRAEHDQPAVAAAVARSSGIVAHGAVGLRRVGGKARVTLADRFHIGSCTKSMTALVLATLVDSGKLRMETTLAGGFPEWRDTMHRELREVTLEQLLTHRGGIPPYTTPDAKQWRLFQSLRGPPPKQRRDFVKEVLREPPVAPPGSETHYSNAGYAAAASLAEKVTGRSWETLVRQRIIGPLKLRSAGFGWPLTAERRDQPAGHRPAPAGTGLAPVPAGDPYRLPACLAPAGDVHLAVDDFARYARLHLRGLRGLDGPVKATVIRRLHRPVGDNAMGWVPRVVGGARASWHNGSAGTFFAWMTVWPDHDLAVVVVTNAHSGEPACQAVTERLFRKYGDSGTTGSGKGR